MCKNGTGHKIFEGKKVTRTKGLPRANRKLTTNSSPGVGKNQTGIFRIETGTGTNFYLKKLDPASRFLVPFMCGFGTKIVVFKIFKNKNKNKF